MTNIKNWIIENKIKLLLGLLSFIAYGALLGWKLSIVLMLALYVHEYGHLLAMLWTNMKTKGIFLVPFFGGATVIEEGYQSYWQHTIIALAGPAIGSLLALFLALYGKVTHLPFFEAAALLTMSINAFNMIPSLPLDGGHWLKCICFSLKPVIGISLLSLICLVIMAASIPVFGWWAPTVWVLGIAQLVVEGYFLIKRHDPNYPEFAIPHILRKQPTALTKKQMLWSVVAYVGICLSLFVTFLMTKNVDAAKLHSYFR